ILFLPFGRVCIHSMDAAECIQADEGQNLIAQAQNFALVDTVNLLIGYSCDLDNRRKRNRKKAATDAEEKRLNAREGEGRTKLNRSSLACLRKNIDRALEPFQNGPNDVHANTTAGDFSDFGRRAEAGLEDQVLYFGIRHAIDFALFQKAFGDGVLAEVVKVNTAAIVANFEDELSALVIGAKGYCSTYGFLRGQSLVGRLDAVVDRVANNVSERFGQRIKNAFIEIGVLAYEFQRDIFAAVLGNVADNAREAPKELFNRHHANFQD